MNFSHAKSDAINILMLAHKEYILNSFSGGNFLISGCYFVVFRMNDNHKSVVTVLFSIVWLKSDMNA